MDPKFIPWSVNVFEKCGLTRADLARILEVHISTVRRWMNRDIGFKEKDNEARWIALAWAVFKAAKAGKLPYRGGLTGEARSNAIRQIIKPFE